MKTGRRFICILLILLLLMPLSVFAAQSDAEAYAEIFKSGTPEQQIQAFLDDPRMFVSVMATEKYGRMIDAIDNLVCPDADVDFDQWQTLLLNVAQENELSQAERRVVRWMLDELGVAFDMWTADIDYDELFGRCAEMDGALPAYYSVELEEVFEKDPYRFLQEMSESDADPGQLSRILMDHIYHCNSDRQETFALLQEMERSGKLNDAQRQMWLQLWRAEGELIGYYGLPFDMEPSAPTEEAPPETTEPEPPAEPTEPAQTEPVKQNDGWLACLILVVVLLAIAIPVALRRKKQ